MPIATMIFQAKETKEEILHIKTVSWHNCFVLFKIFENCSHLICCPKGNRLPAIKLGIIPIHFRQSEYLLGKKSGCLLYLFASNRKRTGDVHSWIRRKEIRTSARVEYVGTVIKAEKRPAERRIHPLTEK